MWMTLVRLVEELVGDVRDEGWSKQLVVVV